MTDVAASAGMVFCRTCGKQISSAAAACPNCGAPQLAEGVSPCKIVPALLLCFFLGWLGAHRFYVGKIGTGILIIVTFGGFFGLWPLIDFIMLLIGSFRDKEGRKLTEWT